MKILVLGASGMLGNAILRFFAESPGYQVFGSARSKGVLCRLQSSLQGSVITGIDVEDADSLIRLFATVHPQVVINCVGLVKQLAAADDSSLAIAINALLPHRLSQLCEVAGARLVHMSTDCIFSGSKGNYTESDISDASDLYGRSKYLGEVDYPHAITLRTSIIGHELNGAHSLLGWFLEQSNPVKGYRRAIFSGLPTVEIARVIRDHVIPHPELHGVYHVSEHPISKFDLLMLVRDIYGKSIDIHPDDQLSIDRSLDSTRFQQMSGFAPKPWLELVQMMREFG